jgi:hypothetical protein
MQKLCLLTILIMTITFSYAQTQGDQEKEWARNVFKTKYKKESYNRFKDKIIIIDKGTVKFNKAIIEYDDSFNEIKNLFLLGILYPQIMSNLFYSDQLHFVNLEEVQSLSDSASIKRFKFWVFQKGFANPNTFLMELTNENATKGMHLKEFIINSKLTFLKYGWTSI